MDRFDKLRPIPVSLTRKQLDQCLGGVGVQACVQLINDEWPALIESTVCPHEKRQESDRSRALQAQTQGYVFPSRSAMGQLNFDLILFIK